MSTTTKFHHGFLFGGVTVTVIALFTLIIEVIPVIWIGGLIVGPIMILEDIVNFNKEQITKSEGTPIEIVSELYNQGNYEETLAVIDNLKYDNSLAQSQIHYMNRLKEKCSIELDNQKFKGSIKEIENLFKDDILKLALEKIFQIESLPISIYTSFYLYSLEARCYAKLNDYSQALDTISKLLDFDEYNPRVEDHILKAKCEMHLYNLVIANQTIKKALNVFPKNKKLISFQKSIE